MLPLSGPFLLLHSGSARDVEVKMITAAEYRAWAEESLEWALIATKDSSRAAFIQWAETWLELASRAERLTALIEDRSKEPTPTARKRRRSSVRPRFDQLAFDFRENLTIAAACAHQRYWRRIAANIAKLLGFTPRD